jgi:phosphatidate cytidylyltransferase
MSDGRPEGTSKALVRTVVGAVYFVIVVGCLFGGITATSLSVSVMACMCCWEFLRLCHASGRLPNDGIALLVTALYPLAPLLNYGNVHLLSTMVLLVALAVWYVAVPRVTISDVALTAFAAIYCGFTFSSVSLIRACDPGVEGAMITFGVMGSIWLNDTFAYFVGTRFGRHKLAPRISPNKSLEGFWGGIAGCMLIWVIMWVLHIRGIKLWMAIGCGLCVGAMAVFGDLFESRIKRGFGVKDSGNLLPGHGGMLDRSDALLFGCMTAFLLLRLGGIV